MRPDYDDVLKSIDMLPKSSKIKIIELGDSVQKRRIRCVQFSDSNIANETKQHALIIAGQHGSEESGRAIAIALMQFLASDHPDSANLLRNQTVAVIPCCNPDGAQADTYHNVDDVNTAHDFPYEGTPVSPEARAIDTFAMEFQPEMHVDIHGLAGGSMNDRIWLESVHGFSANNYFATMMAHHATEDAEKLGYPVCEVRPPGPLNREKNVSGRLGEKLSFELNTLGFGLEAIEHYYREKEWAEVGLHRLRSLLKCGSEDRFQIGAEGYPNNHVSGYLLNGLRAHGSNAAKRRENRSALTKFLRANHAMANRGADGKDGMARVTVSSETVNGTNPDRFSLSVRIKKPCKVEGVAWDGQRLEAAPDHGYRILDQGHSLLVITDLCSPFGGKPRNLEVKYSSPYLSK